MKSKKPAQFRVISVAGMMSNFDLVEGQLGTLNFLSRVSPVVCRVELYTIFVYSRQCVGTIRRISATSLIGKINE
jgi:hypothetical protein